MDEAQNLSEKRIETAIWYLKHKVMLKKIALGIAVAVDAALVGYALLGFGRDLFNIRQRQNQEMELLQVSTLSGTVSSLARPSGLELSGVEILRSRGAIDTVARVANPNPRWYAQFSYEIGLGDEVERFTDGFLLPGEELPFFKTFRGGIAGTPIFNITEISWRRIGPPAIADFEQWRDERIKFEVRDNKFIPADTRGISRARFVIQNKSGFGYIEPAFFVFLYSGTRLVAIERSVVPEFRSGEARTVEVSWFEPIGRVSDMEVVPAIDILNDTVYLRPGG